MELVTWAALVLLISTAQTEILIDDQHGAPTFTTTGDDWTTWGTNGYGYDGSDTEYHYLSHTVGGEDRRGTATWTPTLPVEGNYRVETWFRRTDNRTDDADHYIHDGLGGETHLSIDQRGKGASGWVDLGEYWCAVGTGGCFVVLDGTDDDQSDEANAVRFVLIDEDPDPGPDACDDVFAPGEHVLEWYAGDAGGSGWEAVGDATGTPDGAEAHSPNVEPGEVLIASDWDICDPDGDEIIERVEIEVLSRVQYESGPYHLILALDGGGAAAVTFSHEAQAWDGVDITGDLAVLDWAHVGAVSAHLRLHDHPGGNIDSDAWVDAFRLRVTFTAQQDPGDDDGGDDDDADDDEVGDDDTDGAADDDGGGPPEGDCSCSAPGARGGGSLAVLGLVVTVFARRRGRAPR